MYDLKFGGKRMGVRRGAGPGRALRGAGGGSVQSANAEWRLSV